MRLLAVFAVFVLPISALAEELPWFANPSSSVTILHPAPSVDFLYTPSGHSASVVTPLPGLRWYSADDPQGRITAQGYLFDPLLIQKPLTVPPSMRDDPQARRR